MYTTYFNLSQAPFSIAPDPRYLFMSERHREALAHLLYGINSGGGFVLLTGEIGAGKTTVCRCFLEQVPANCRLAYIFNPKLSVGELLQSVCEEFRIPAPPAGGGVKGYVDAINHYLLASHSQGRNNVLIIDEAQNLAPDVLEQLRLLTNLETSERKLLQIILIGQPELRTILARPELEQLAQRVIARYHLGPLSEAETGAYIGHRMAVGGAQGAPVFPRSLLALVHRISGGVPRRINLLCDRALLGAYVENSREVTRLILRKAAQEVFAGETRLAAPGARWPWLAGGLLAGAALSAAAWQVLPARPAHEGAPRALARGTIVAAERHAGGALRAAAAGGGAGAGGLASAAGTAGAGAGPGAGVSAGAAGAISAGAAGAAAAGAGAAGAGTLAPAAARPQALSPVPPALQDEGAALRVLAGLWGAALPPGAPCAVAFRLDLRCHAGRGGMYELRQIDRPAVITLRDGQASSYAVLVGMDAAGVTLLNNGKRERVELAALVPRFTGEYTTFWKMPRAFRDQLANGDQGPDVDWLGTRLAQLSQQAAPAPQRAFDARLQAALRTFQLQQNLKADGVAGPRTYMRLNQLTGVAEPRLLAAAGRGG